jgi:hypothetical protein
VCSIEQKTTGDVTVTANGSSRNGGGGNWQRVPRWTLSAALHCTARLLVAACFSELPRNFCLDS